MDSVSTLRVACNSVEDHVSVTMLVGTAAKFAFKLARAHVDCPTLRENSLVHAGRVSVPDPTFPAHLIFLPPIRLLFPALGLPCQYLLSVLVKLQLRDNHLTGMNPDRYTLPIGLIAHDTLDVNDVFEAVNRRHGTFAAFVGTPDYGDFVIFAYWYGANLAKHENVHDEKRAKEINFVLGSEFFVERCGHDRAADTLLMVLKSVFPVLGEN